MKTAYTKGVIFVFGNPLQKVKELAKKYKITVIGTNDPTMLQSELTNANDADNYYFIISDKEELKYMNDILSKVRFTTELKWFVIINKKLDRKLNTHSNSVFVATYEEPLTEKIIDEYILHTTVYSQEQYILRTDDKPLEKLSSNKMRLISKNLQHNFDNESLLQTIKEQFNEIAKKQESLPVSEILQVEKINFNTQEYLEEEIAELESRLESAHNQEDMKQVLSVIMELYEMMSSDLRDSSKKLIDKLIKESLEKSKQYKENSENLKKDFDNAVRIRDKERIQEMIRVREERITEVKAVEKEVMRNANRLKEGLTDSFIALGEKVKGTIAKHNNLVDESQKMALQNAFNNSSKEVSLDSRRVVEGVQIVLSDLQNVVRQYSTIVDFDTALIESQQKQINILETQNIVEEVKFTNELQSKLRMFVSPTPNLGASTMIKMFQNKYPRLLMLDFRDITSDTVGFKEMTYEEFIGCNLDELEAEGIKVFSKLAAEVDRGELEDRLHSIVDMFDGIFIVSDRYFQTGVNPEIIQRIQYLSNPKDSNLIIINQTRGFYEDMLNETRRVSFILNMVTDNVHEYLNDKLTVAGIDPSNVRINIVPLRAELMGGMNIESELRVLHSQFKY